MARISVEVPEEISERLTAFAARTQSSMEDVVLRAVMETLAAEDELAAMIAHGKEDIAAGHLVPHEDVMRELETWARGLRNAAG